MKFKQFTILFGAVLVFALGGNSLANAADHLKLKECYNDIIDDLIDKCKYKTQMRHSKSDVIRNAAMLSCLKITFYKKNRQALIQTMLDADIGIKRYKVEYYLNTQFYNLFRPHKQTVAKYYLRN